MHQYRLRQQYVHSQSGLTLIEIMLVTAIMALISSIALPIYNGYINRARINVAIQDIRKIELLINDVWFSDQVMPASLDELGVDFVDPWGSPYEYYDIRNANGNGGSRKEHGIVPLNSDFDLYSMGADCRSATPLTSRLSYDDIVRANNGRFIDLAEKY